MNENIENGEGDAAIPISMKAIKAASRRGAARPAEGRFINLRQGYG